jgi:hypothetical protein
MKRKSAPSKKRPRSARTGPLRQRSAQASAELTPETEMPLDAEDVALASLEAKVRAEEAMADVGPARLLAGLTVRLPLSVIAQLRAEAVERNITPSKLVELALAQYLPFKRARRRTR